MQKVFETKDSALQVKYLDSAMSKLFIGFSNSVLKKAVQIILDANNKLPVTSLAKKLSVSDKTLLRHFKKNLHCSTKDYISAVQFRKALNTYKLSTHSKTFTEHAYQHNYYDQADFINHFRKITGFSPTKLFKMLEHIGEEDTIWARF